MKTSFSCVSCLPASGPPAREFLRLFAGRLRDAKTDDELGCSG
jgi:hypothetical protein